MDARNCLFMIQLSFIAATIIIVSVHGYNPWEKDMTVVVSQVVDGDTFHTTSGDSVRLADIDTPEIGQPGANEATNVLASLVGDKTVYLDIDDISKTDTHGRLVCVVYVDYNSTHVKNVNKALLVEGVAEIWDHTNNEFDPYTWTLYNQKTETQYIRSPVPTEAIIAILLLTAVSIVILIKRKTRK